MVEVKFKLATVTALFEDGTAKIQFFGEDKASEKEYSYIASYAPTVGDKVFLAPFADSYIIIGKVLYMEKPSYEPSDPSDPGADSGYVTAEYMISVLEGYSKTNHTHSGYAASNHTHSQYAASGHTHDCTTSDAGYTVGWLNSTQAWGPRHANSVSCGGSTYKWSVVYAATSAISTSDRNMKKNIRQMGEDERYEKMFHQLQPVIYQFIDNSSDREHSGFIAQDVLEAMNKAGIDSKEFAGYIEMLVYKKDESGEDTEEVERTEYGLRYEEFIALNTMMLQKSMERISELERRLEKLEG